MVVITLKRNQYYAERTFGEFFVNNDLVCLSLEDAVRSGAESNGKIAGRTAIPAGRYKVNLSWSNRFGKMYLEILNVVNFTGIRIHSGNVENDTDGCLLTGTKRVGNSVIGSKIAQKKLESVVLTAFINDPDRQIWIDVIDTQKPVA